MRHLALIALILLTDPTIGVAQEAVSIPEGCEAFVTVQSRSCSVSHHYICKGDPEGHQWRMDLDDVGPNYVGRIDAETQWIESFDLLSGIRDALDPDPKDAASFTDLSRNGRDDFEFSTTASDGTQAFYKGRDLLTGKTVIIDDVPLLETETFARATDAEGNLVWESTGNEYISLEWRMFLSGRYSTRTPDDQFNYDNSPVEFIYPDEPGFLTAVPTYGCTGLML